MTEIKAELSSRKKWRNTKEYHTTPTASAHGITIEGHGAVMQQLAKALIDAGKPQDQRMSAYRVDMECLKPQTLEKWASGKVGKGKQPEHLRRKGA